MKKALYCGLTMVALGWLLIPASRAAEAPSAEPYTIKKLREARTVGLDLHRSMKPKQREAINTEPVSVETDVTPAIKMAELTEDNKTLGMVFVTAGFIDLVDNVAHAKAIDTIEKGYFEKYVLGLAQETGEKELKELPNIKNPKYWTETIMNEHISNLRQMMGTAVAIKLSHHYLGHYKKYKEKLEDAQGKRIPINNLLTSAEWEEALRAGTRNGLEAGLGIEGIKALYDAIDKMPKRPEWTAYFLPASAKVKAIKKEMEKMEKKFFAGEE